MNKDDMNEVELRIRKYFDVFMKEHMPNILKAHVNECPHGRKVVRWKWIAIGIGVGVGLQFGVTGLKAVLSML